MRIALKNEVVAKQKRLVHDISIFGVEIQKFFELLALVTHGQIVVFYTPSGAYVTFEYSYQGNDYKYYLMDEDTEDFFTHAREKNLKYKEHEL